MAASLRVLPLVSTLALAVLLAGCSNGPNGQSASSAGNLAYNGASSGTQASEPFGCDGSGTIDLSANLGSGSVTFTVKDASGKVAYSKSVSGPGQSADDQAVTGAKGDWTITAVRGAGFSGQYAVSVDC